MDDTPVHDRVGVDVKTGTPAVVLRRMLHAEHRQVLAVGVVPRLGLQVHKPPCDALGRPLIGRSPIASGAEARTRASWCPATCSWRGHQSGTAASDSATGGSKENIRGFPGWSPSPTLMAPTEQIFTLQHHVLSLGEQYPSTEVCDEVSVC